MTKKRRTRGWALSIGERGYTVRVFERERGSVLYIRWWDPNTGAKGDWRWRSLKHRDRELAERQARELAAALLASNDADVRGRATVGTLLGRYEREVTPRKTPAQQREDLRRLGLWTHYLGAARDVLSVDVATLDAFVGDRRAGRVAVPGHLLNGQARGGTCPECDGDMRQTYVRQAWLPKTCERCTPRDAWERMAAQVQGAAPSDRTIAMDLAFLQTVYRWAEGLRTADGQRVLRDNPIARYAKPITANPKRPLVSRDRFEQLLAHADQVDPQRLFGSFLSLIESLGWRVSAVCRLWASDFDPRISAELPFGRLRKRPENDKEKVSQWVPIGPDTRAALLTVLERRPVAGDVYLFPSPRRAGQPWRRTYARDLLELCENAAGLTAIDGGDWHPFRRKWVSERKHLPDVDVAAAGGWKTTRTLQECYQQPDEKTMLAVVLEPRRLREVK